MTATAGPIPSTPRFAIRRTHLEERLERGIQNRLTLVAAPSGYGKTHLLAQWVSERQGPAVPWLTLDSGDDNALRLARRLVAALETLEPDLGRTSLEHLDEAGAVLGHNFIRQLVIELALLDECVIVMDDLGSVTN